MTFYRIAARFALGLGLLWPAVAPAWDAAPHWQGLSLSAGSATKSKLDGAEARALSVVGRSRSLSRLVPLAALDPWRWRPVMTAGSLYRDRVADGVQILVVSAQVGRRLGPAVWGVEPYVAFGFDPTVLSDDVIGPLIVGGDLQFTSHATLGITVPAALPFRVAYRLSHTSNGGLRSENPGVDLSGLIIEFPMVMR